MTVIKMLSHPLTPYVGSKVKYLNFALTQSVIYIFIIISHADRGTIDMKHIKRDFRSKARARPLGWTKGVGSKGQNASFSEHGHVYISN